MKSIIYSITLVGCLSVGNSLFAQGRSGGRAGVPIEIPTRPEPAASRPADVDRGNRPNSDQNANANSQASTRKAQGTKDASVQLAENPALLTRLKTVYPNKTDEQLTAMAKEFGSLGAFMAAVHVSNNLGINWDELKTNMTTGGMSLGKAIQKSKPELTSQAVDAEVKKAEAQAKKDTSGKS